MYVKTNSLVSQIEADVNKSIQTINTEDLLKVKQIFHNSLQLDGSVCPIFTADLLLFNNLEILGLANAVLYEEDIKNISSLKLLKKISFYNCEVFSDCKILEKIQLIENLDITNSKFINYGFIHNFINLKAIQVDNKTYTENINLFLNLKESRGVETKIQTEDKGD